jgi:hypothetical protein
MTLGTDDKKKVKWLAGLLVVAGIAVYFNLSDSSSTTTPTPAAAPKSQTGGTYSPMEMPQAGPSTSSAQAPPRRLSSTRGDDFRPAFRSKRPEDRIDPLTIDPTLRTDLLAKLQEMKPEGGSRNLFQFGAAPAPEKLKGPEPIIAVAAKRFDYPRPLPPPPPPAEPPPPPPEPPIDVKYYGIATKQIDGKKTAFFLDSADNTTIILAIEGGIVKKKYRVVRIGVTSVLMENVDNKKQQSLPIAEDAGANMGN